MSGDKKLGQLMIIASYFVLVILFQYMYISPIFDTSLFFIYHQSNNFSIVRQAEYSILQIKIVHHTKLYLLR